MPVRLLDTTPRWLRLTLGCSSAVLVVTGIGFFFGQLTQFDITPFTLLLHLTLAIAVAVVVGSIWSSVQQWIGYFQTGVVSDIMLVAGATLMDIAGGCVIYTLFHLNILKK